MVIATVSERIVRKLCLKERITPDELAIRIKATIRPAKCIEYVTANKGCIVIAIKDEFIIDLIDTGILFTTYTAFLVLSATIDPIAQKWFTLDEKVQMDSMGQGVTACATCHADNCTNCHHDMPALDSLLPCRHCGQRMVKLSAAQVRGGVTPLCDDCFSKLNKEGI